MVVHEMRGKTTTFLSAGHKYGLRFVKKSCTHMQVLGVVAMGKDEQQGCNVSYCWQQPLLFSVELSISIDVLCWQAAKRSHAAITELLFFCKWMGAILCDALLGSQRLCTNGPFEDCQVRMFVKQCALPSADVFEAAKQAPLAATCCWK